MLIEQLDQKLGDELHDLRVIELDAARPSEVARILERVVIGTDQNRFQRRLVIHAHLFASGSGACGCSVP